MYMNFWYAAEWGKAVTAEKPVKLRILKHDLVLFRDRQGKAHALSDTCIHRGGSLGAGKVRGDTVQCPYHGWRFGGDGKCTRIPSIGLEKDAQIPARARVDAYPVQEKYGLVFVFLGDLPEEDRPPLLEIAEWGQPGWKDAGVDYVWTANYERMIENGLDPAHNEFVHPTHGSDGEIETRKVPDFDIEETEWSTGFLVTFEPPTKKTWLTRLMGQKNRAKPRAGTKHIGPHQMLTSIFIDPKRTMQQYVYECPIDEFTTRSFLINMRSFVTSKFLDNGVNKRNVAVALQDKVVVEKLAPKRAPQGTIRELLMPADKPIVAYRKKLKGLEAKGWKLDIAAINAAQERGDAVFAIPSPARRESKGWVLEPVPCLPPTAQPGDEASLGTMAKLSAAAD